VVPSQQSIIFTMTELQPLLERILTYSQELERETGFKYTALFDSFIKIDHVKHTKHLLPCYCIGVSKHSEAI
jgi:hypothetical protein